jgi:hypothetical protein
MKKNFTLVSGSIWLLAGMLWFAAGSTVQAQQPYTFTTIAGSAGYGSADGTNTAAHFDWPTGVAVDSAGNVYVADAGNSTIRKLTRAGTNLISSTIAGLACQYGSADGTNSEAQFFEPMGVTVDGGGNVYVVDTGNFTIRKITPDGTNWIVTTIAGLAGSPGSADGTNSNARFGEGDYSGEGPSGIVADNHGNVYVTDTFNHTIRKISPDGINWVVTTIAGLAGIPGSADGINSNAWFNQPFGIAMDAAGALYVADTYNQTVRKLTPVATESGTNWVVTTIAGSAGSLGSADGINSNARFNYPFGIAMDAAGALYVADTDNQTVRKLTPVATESGTDWVVTTIAGLAYQYGSADGTNSDARFNMPEGLAAESDGTVYVADTGNSTIRKIVLMNTNWVVTTAAGLAGGPGSDDGVNGDARFSSPTGTAVDNSGNVFVTDLDNNTIRKITPVGNDWVVTTIAGIAGSSGSDDGMNSNARFNSPAGIAVDGNGNLYVADGGNGTIRKVAPVGTNWVVTTIAGGHQIIYYYYYGLARPASVYNPDDGTNSDAYFDNPYGMAVDGKGNLYVTDEQTVRQVSPAGTNWVVTTIAGQPGSSGWADGTNGDVLFNGPAGLAVAPDGNVYVADEGNEAIRKLTPDGTNWVVTTIAGWPGVSGSQDGVNTNMHFFQPYGIAVDSDDNLYVADTGNNLIRKLAPMGSDWVGTTIGGQLMSGANDGTGDAAQFNWPQGIAMDSGGNVYVADTYNCTIRRGVPGSTVISSVPGSTVILSVPGGQLQYQWRHNGANISGATNSTYTVTTNAQPPDAGVYDVLVSSLVSNEVSTVIAMSVVVTVVGPGLPFADNFPGGSTNGFSFMGSGDNTHATSQTNEPAIAGNPASHSLWLQWTAPADGVMQLSTRGSTFDTVLAVYTGTNLTDLTLVASDDDSGGYFTSQVFFNAAAGSKYLIAVDGSAGATGRVVLSGVLNTNISWIPQILLQPADVTVLAGDTATFTVSAAGITNLTYRQFPDRHHRHDHHHHHGFAASTTNLTYQWYVGNWQAIPGATNATLTISNVSPSDVNIYGVIVTGNGQNVASLRATLEIGPSLSFDKLQDLLRQLSLAAGGGSSYIKFIALASSASFPSVSAGTIGSQLINNFNSTTQQGEPIQDNTIGGSSRWYLLTAAANGTMVIDTMGSTVATLLSVYTGGDIFSLHLVASNRNSAPDGIHSLVRFPAASGTNYLIQVDGVNGVQSSNIYVNWRLGTPPNVVVITQSFAIARGTNLLFSAGMSNNVTSPTYQWRCNGMNIAGATNATYALTNIQFYNCGSYSVVVSNLVGVVTNVIALVSVDAPLTLDVSALPANVRISGSATQAVVLLSSTNLTSWKSLYTNPSPLLPINYLDTNLLTRPNGFYRLKRWP